MKVFYIFWTVASILWCIIYVADAIVNGGLGKGNIDYLILATLSYIVVVLMERKEK